MAKILKEIKTDENELFQPEKPIESVLKKAEPVEEKTEPVKKESKKQTDAEKLDELYMQKELLKKQVKEFHDSRKAKMNYKEAKEHRQQLQKLRDKVGDVRQKIFDLKFKLNKEKKSKVKVSQVAVKQAKFLSLYKQGFSISNITRHPDGVSIDSIEGIMTPEFVEQMDKIDKRFIPMWIRWQEKFLPKK